MFILHQTKYIIQQNSSYENLILQFIALQLFLDHTVFRNTYLSGLDMPVERMFKRMVLFPYGV